MLGEVGRTAENWQRKERAGVIGSVFLKSSDESAAVDA